MDEEDRKHLYASLLRGLANTCQDQLCAQDKQHAWGMVIRTALRHDRPIQPVSFDAPIADEVFRVKHERTCQNCGKHEVW